MPKHPGLYYWYYPMLGPRWPRWFVLPVRVAGSLVYRGMTVCWPSARRPAEPVVSFVLGGSDLVVALLWSEGLFEGIAAIRAIVLNHAVHQ